MTDPTVQWFEADAEEGASEAAPGRIGAWIVTRLRLWGWLHSRGYWWFQRRRPFELPSVIYEGLPGSGKTLAMVRECVEWMREDFTVASNLRIRDALTGRETLPCTSWLQMLELVLEHKRQGVPIIIAIDEIHTMCDAREWANTPQWWRDMMSQKRHHGLGLIGTTQALSQVEKRLRSLVAYLVRYERIVQPPSAAVAIVPMLIGMALGAVGWWWWFVYLGHSVVWLGWLTILIGAIAGACFGLAFGLALYNLGNVLARLSFYRESILDPTGVDMPSSEWQEISSTVTWVPWYAYHSYDTWATITGEDMTAMSDQLIQERIASHMAALAELGEGRPIVAFADLDADTPEDDAA